MAPRPGRVSASTRRPAGPSRAIATTAAAARSSAGAAPATRSVPSEPSSRVTSGEPCRRSCHQATPAPPRTSTTVASAVAARVRPDTSARPPAVSRRTWNPATATRTARTAAPVSSATRTTVGHWPSPAGTACRTAQAVPPPRAVPASATTADSATVLPSTWAPVAPRASSSWCCVSRVVARRRASWTTDSIVTRTSTESGTTPSARAVARLVAAVPAVGARSPSTVTPRTSTSGVFIDDRRLPAAEARWARSSGWILVASGWTVHRTKGASTTRTTPSGGTTSGPRSVPSRPAATSGSPNQKASSAATGRQRPVTSTSAPPTTRVSPTRTPQVSAAAACSMPWTGSAPGEGQVPSTTSTRSATSGSSGVSETLARTTSLPSRPSSPSRTGRGSLTTVRWTLTGAGENASSTRRRAAASWACGSCACRVCTRIPASCGTAPVSEARAAVVAAAPE
ncbi:hypothetical protein [Ornithinimicrobium kibberense]|uniref:hypothetical protein n=1 Tax=Ornithinimicrobium kibberense TaxID=282060 RepID=UPI00361737BC